MSEQQFEVFQECEYLEEWSSCPYCIKYNGETVFETLPLGIAKEVCKKLNEQLSIIRRDEMSIKTMMSNIEKLEKENEQLRHELDSLTGCYCADNKEFKDYWRIGYDD